MTSSSSFELAVRQRGLLIGKVEASELDPHARGLATEEAQTDVPLWIRIDRPAGARTWGRVRVGDAVLLVLQPGQASMEASTDLLREEYGEATLVYEEAEPDEPGKGYALLELRVALRARPEIEALYERLVADLEAVHAGLAQDVLSRTTHRAALGRTRATAVRLEAEVERLSRLCDALPGRSPDRSPAFDGAPAPRATRRPVASRGEAAALDGRARRPRGGDGRRRGSGARAREGPDRPHAHDDRHPEHRHLREGLRRLAARSRAVARHCRRMADLYLADRARWGRDRNAESSVFAKRALPRVRVLEGFEERALALAARFGRLTQDHEFVATAGPARSRLAPTPIFVNRPGYRDAYLALREAEGLSRALVEGEEIRLRYRQLSTLFEYWTFVKVVDLVRQQPGMGPAEPRDAIEVIDDVYRPELAPGQSLRFPYGRGRFVTVAYEPDFPPAGRPSDAPHPFRAALSEAPLRPDGTVQLDREGQPPAILVLDAKSHGRFDPQALWEMTDYRTRIFDLRTGHQPVRQVSLLHRDAAAEPLVNLPGYLDQRAGIGIRRSWARSPSSRTAPRWPAGWWSVSWRCSGEDDRRWRIEGRTAPPRVNTQPARQALRWPRRPPHPSASGTQPLLARSRAQSIAASCREERGEVVRGRATAQPRIPMVRRFGARRTVREASRAEGSASGSRRTHPRRNEGGTGNTPPGPGTPIRVRRGRRPAPLPQPSKPRRAAARRTWGRGAASGTDARLRPQRA